MGRKVMIPVDGSPHSRRAFDFYAEKILDPGDTVYIVHMFTPPNPPALSLRSPTSQVWDEWIVKVDQTLKDGREIVKEYERLCDGKVTCKVIIHSDSPGQGICDLARDNSPDMIIMGCRGLNALRRTFMGSVSDYVIHHANVPVTIVPPTKEE